MGHIGHPEVMVAGRFNGGRGSRDTTFLMDVRAAGIYPVRLITFSQAGAGSVELFTVKDDGTKVLVNDTANGGLAAFRSGTVPEYVEPAPEPEPGPAEISIASSGSGVVITYSGGTLQSAAEVTGPWTEVAGASSPHEVSAEGGAAFFRVQ